MNNKSTRAIRPDAQPFDEIRITTVPRYKMSGLSGDEWRISAKMEFLRKGKIEHEEIMGNIESAVKYLSWLMGQACDSGKAYYGGIDDFCDQEGCSEKATRTYRLKKEYCNQGCAHEIKYGDKIRMFCDRHSKRGDCGLEDSDANYELVAGQPAEEPQESDKKQATFGGIISLEDLPASE